MRPNNYLFSLALISLLQFQPAVADDVQNPPAATTQNQTAAKGEFNILDVPKYTLGVVAGTIVGVPVNLVRRTIWETKLGMKGLCGDSKNKFAQVSAGTFWLPFGIFLAACETPVMSPVTSLRHYDKPFSKEQFSLGPLSDGNDRDPQ